MYAQTENVLIYTENSHKEEYVPALFLSKNVTIGFYLWKAPPSLHNYIFVKCNYELQNNTHLPRELGFYRQALTSRLLSGI